LADLLRSYPDRVRGPSEAIDDEFIEVDHIAPGGSVSTRDAPPRDGGVSKLRVVRKLLELRAREAPLGSPGYRGVLTQKAIAETAEVPVRQVMKMAMDLDKELNSPTQPAE
jgi:hypothetical protein